MWIGLHVEKICLVPVLRIEGKGKGKANGRETRKETTEIILA